MRTNTLDTHGGCTHHAEADEKKGTKTVERKFSSVEVKRKRKKSWGWSTGYSYAAVDSPFWTGDFEVDPFSSKELARG